MKSIFRITIALLVLLVLAGGLVWGFLTGRSEQAAESESDAPIEAASRITHENGKTILAFDAGAQRTNGIVVTALVADRRSAASAANGVVLQLQPLLDLKTSFNVAQMDIAKARAASQASQAEYKRLLALNQTGENVSAKAVETAQATAESDAAILQNAEQSLTVLTDSMSLHWGATVASWLEQGSPQLDALFAQHAFLLQVTPSNYTERSAPAEVVVQLPDGAHVSAHLLSALPQLDPRLQAPSYLYIVSAHTGLVPGINLPFFLASGPVQSGGVVPSSAVVWWQGKAWCYVEESPGKFSREEVPTTNATPAGWFVSEGVRAGMRVVTAGAQTLLSEEFRAQIQTDED